MIMSPRFVAISLCISLVLSADVLADPNDESTIPWDYRDSSYAENLHMVDAYHFNSDVQMLARGQTHTFPGRDLEFILRYFANHHGALNTMGQLWRRHRNLPNFVPQGLTAEKNADYYFRRAIEFVPDDGIVRMLYGTYLFLDGRIDLALIEYEAALELAPNSPEVHYNAGLYFVAVGNYEVAVKHAKFAYEAGYPLPGLRRKLVSHGAWKEATE